MRIAVLGMGRMGQTVAARLLAAGHDVVVWNRTPGRASGLTDRGAREADSVASACSGVDVVVTSLANDEAVRQVALGDGGVHASIDDDTVYLDASTVSPALSGELEERFPRFAAMPILGSPAVLAGGQAIVLIGGHPSATTVADAVVPGLSDKVRHYDSAPLASTAKLAVNLLLLDGLVALAESVAVGRAGGLSDEQLRQLLGDSPVLAPGLKNRFEGILSGDQNPWWSTALGAKDAGLAADMVSMAGGELPLTAMARDLYTKVATSGYPDADIAAVTHLYRP
jgi:3-hydroxyisobutyrate dehydrogenase-like beta-hydroxyacid dehydrogenase